MLPAFPSRRAALNGFLGVPFLACITYLGFSARERHVRQSTDRVGDRITNTPTFPHADLTAGDQQITNETRPGLGHQTLNQSLDNRRRSSLVGSPELDHSMGSTPSLVDIKPHRSSVGIADNATSAVTSNATSGSRKRGNLSSATRPSVDKSLTDTPDLPELPLTTLTLGLKNVDNPEKVSLGDISEKHAVDENLKAKLPEGSQEYAFAYPCEALPDGAFVYYKDGGEVVAILSIVKEGEGDSDLSFENQWNGRAEGENDCPSSGYHKITLFKDAVQFCWMPECKVTSDVTLGCFMYKMRETGENRAYVTSPGGIEMKANSSADPSADPSADSSVDRSADPSADPSAPATAASTSQQQPCACVAASDLPFERNEKNEVILPSHWYPEHNGLLTRPSDFGSSCKAWDENTEPKCNKGSNEWCSLKWCYVHKDCACGDAKPHSPLTKTLSLEDAAVTEATDLDPDGRLYYSCSNCGEKSCTGSDPAPEQIKKLMAICRGEMLPDSTARKSPVSDKNSVVSSLSLTSAMFFYMASAAFV